MKKMKRLFMLAMAMMSVMSLAFAACSSDDPAQPETPEVEIPEEPVSPPDGQKILVVFYSHSGNTRQIAGYIHETVESDLIELETVDSYPESYDEHLAQVRREVASNYRPPLSTRIENISEYDIIFVGYPIWVETAAPPVTTFLAGYDLAGKTVVPFCTSGTSSAEASYRLVRSLCPESTVLEGIQIRRGTYDTAHERVVGWLQQIGIVESNKERNDEE